jgi:hypothetical protein
MADVSARNSGRYTRKVKALTNNSSSPFSIAVAMQESATSF